MSIKLAAMQLSKKSFSVVPIPLLLFFYATRIFSEQSYDEILNDASNAMHIETLDLEHWDDLPGIKYLLDLAPQHENELAGAMKSLDDRKCLLSLYICFRLPTNLSDRLSGIILGIFCDDKHIQYVEFYAMLLVGKKVVDPWFGKLIISQGLRSKYSKVVDTARTMNDRWINNQH